MSIRVAILAAAVLAGAPHPSHAQLITHRDLSLKMALAIAQSALEVCGDTTSIAVVDRAGRVRVLLEGDNASPHNAELARRKAYTARTFRTPSSEWAKRTETANAGQRELSEVIPLGGGMPIKVGEDTVGGVGLSGAVGGQPMEEKCANAGIASVAQHLK
jgi:uncharacterized protein GlcG (DUF336 family)